MWKGPRLDRIPAGVQVSEGPRASGGRTRTASWADGEVVGGILGRAFIDDPVTSHLLPDAASRPAKLPRIFKLLFKLCEPHGACTITSGGEAAALWLPPNEAHIPIWEYLRNGSAFLGVFGVLGALRALTTMDRIDKAHPTEPHWYLMAIGTDPAHQGKGYGSLVMRDQLRVADSEGMPAYLETATPKNVLIYKGFGFETVDEVRIPDGPTLTTMWREARPQTA